MVCCRMWKRFRDTFYAIRLDSRQIPLLGTGNQRHKTIKSLTFLVQGTHGLACELQDELHVGVMRHCDDHSVGWQPPWSFNHSTWPPDCLELQISQLTRRNTMGLVPRGGHSRPKTPQVPQTGKASRIIIVDSWKWWVDSFRLRQIYPRIHCNKGRVAPSLRGKSIPNLLRVQFIHRPYEFYRHHHHLFILDVIDRNRGIDTTRLI